MLDGAVKNLLLKAQGMKIGHVSYNKGDGIFASRLEIGFVGPTETLAIDVECAFRVLDGQALLLTNADAWIDTSGRWLSERRLKQKGITDTYLSAVLQAINERVSNTRVSAISVQPYGDIDIRLQNGIDIQIINDTAMDYDTLYTIIQQGEHMRRFTVYCRADDVLSEEIPD